MTEGDDKQTINLVRLSASAGQLGAQVFVSVVFTGHGLHSRQLPANGSLEADLNI